MLEDREYRDFDRYTASNKQRGMSFDASNFELQLDTFVETSEGHRPPRRHVMIDIGQFPHIDKTGLRVLLTIRKKLQSTDGDLVLSNVRPTVKADMDLIGITPLLRIAEK
jgi:anti-anti-sigma factor